MTPHGHPATMPAEPSVQRLTLLDWPSARRVLRASFPAIEPQELRRALSTRPALTGVVRDGQEVVALVTLRLSDEQSRGWLPCDRLWIDMLAVAPGQRGRRLGEHLVRWALSQAADRGLADVGLSVHAVNAPAIALYQRLGFTVDARAADEPTGRLRLVRRTGAAPASTPLAGAVPALPSRARLILERARLRVLAVAYLITAVLQDAGVMDLLSL
jgi:ribosomal protein S18 acetylase RimI-like enzyme